MSSNLLRRRGRRRIDQRYPVNMSHPLNRGLLAWWLCLPGRLTGFTWYDLLGNYNGTIVNANVAGTGLGPTRRRGGFGEFDSTQASNSAVVVAPAAKGPWCKLGTGDFTLSCWTMIPTGTTFGVAPFFSSNYDGGGHHWGLQNNRILLAFVGSASPVISTFVQPNDGSWHHLVLTRQAGVVTHYVDGAQAGTPGSPFNGTMANTSIDNRICARGGGGSGQSFTGGMDSYRIYNRALPAAEISLLYLNELQGNPGTLRRRQRLLYPNFATVTRLAGQGGTAAGGQTNQTQYFSIRPQGGPVLGGRAPPTYSALPLGGALLSGQTKTTYINPPMGGLLAGGQTSSTLTYSVPVLGGTLIGGQTSYVRAYTPSGGVVQGGPRTLVQFSILAMGGLMFGSTTQPLVNAPPAAPGLLPPAPWPQPPATPGQIPPPPIMFEPLAPSQVKINPFNRVMVDYAIRGTATISWDINPHFHDPGPWTFQLQVSKADLSNDHAPFVDVGEPLGSDSTQTTDYIYRAYGKEVETYYRVLLTTAASPFGPARTYASDPASVWGHLDFHTWHLMQEMVRKESLRLQRLKVGVPGYLLKARRAGTLCPRCTDAATGDQTDGYCPICYGTRFQGGYYQAQGQIYIDQGLFSIYVHLDANLGTSEGQLPMVKGHFVGMPTAGSFDVWCNQTADLRYYLRKKDVTAHIRGVPFVYEIEMELAPFSDIIYQVPLHE